MDELRTLYKKGAGSRNITPLLKTTDFWVWSGETEGSSYARYFTFNDGGKSWSGREHDTFGRVFAVRSRSDG